MWGGASAGASAAVDRRDSGSEWLHGAALWSLASAGGLLLVPGPDDSTIDAVVAGTVNANVRGAPQFNVVSVGNR